MGNTRSLEEKKEAYLDLFGRFERENLIPDISIDVSLVKYSRLDSAAVLENSIKDMIDSFPGYVESLGSALSAFTSVPNAAGLGALALAMLLEVINKSEEESEDSTVDMLRRVFAEEKASGVRDSMDEYLKRLGMYLHQPRRALEETERLEKQLSDQLTRLKNSMLYDNQMNSRFLKQWANGAAFHLQMLIHAARLEFQSSTKDKQLQVHLASITGVLNLYQNNLEELLKQYKAYKKSTIVFGNHCNAAPYGYPAVTPIATEKELNGTINRSPFHWSISSEYVDCMFDNWKQLKELRSYFNDLKENLQDLIKQNGEFNMQNVLPDE